MANTITLNITVGVKDGSGGVSMASTDSVAQVGSNYSKSTQTILRATPTQLAFDANIADGNLGYVVIRNLNAKVAGAANVNVATDAAMINVILTIPPSISHVIQPAHGTINLWAQADTADTPCTVMGIET